MTALPALPSRVSEVRAEMPMTEADFEALVRQHQGMVFSLAWHFFRNEAVAEEVAQEVFLRLYENLERLESPAHVAFWLRRTTSHRCIDHLRQRRAWREVQCEELPEVAVNPEVGDPLLSERLRRLVASLPEKPRLVVLLRFAEDLDAEEIGRVLKMPVRTVWSHLYRGLALLREKASRYLGEVAS